MRRSTRSVVTTLTALVAVIGLWMGAVVNSAFTQAATAFIMGGNSHPLSIPQDTTEFITGYVDSADTYFISPSGLCDSPCALVAVYTPEQFRFVTGIFDMTFDQSVEVGQANLDECIQGDPCTVTTAPYVQTEVRTVPDSSYVIYGYSESATIASNQKLDLIAHPVSTPVSFLLLANPNRPNGGILERFVGTYIPIVGVTFNGATPTFSPEPAPLTTVDIARQYDGWADFPTKPLNLLADINALMGTVLVHGNYFGTATPQLQGQYRDTTYYLIPTQIVPLLVPLTWIPLVGRPLAAGLDPALRVLIELGYDRTVNPGEPTPAKYFYVPDLVKAALDLIVAIPTGVDNAFSVFTGNPDCRPLHTEVPSSPFGVGGPPVYTGAIDPYGEPVPYDSVSANEDTTDIADIAAVSDAATGPTHAVDVDDAQESTVSADSQVALPTMSDTAPADRVGDGLLEAVASDTVLTDVSSLEDAPSDVQSDGATVDPDGQVSDSPSESEASSSAEPAGDASSPATAESGDPA